MERHSHTQTLQSLTTGPVFRVFWSFSADVVDSEDSELDPDPEARSAFLRCSAAQGGLYVERQNFHGAEITWRNHRVGTADSAVSQTLSHTHKRTTLTSRDPVRLFNQESQQITLKHNSSRISKKNKTRAFIRKTFQ